MPWLSINPWSEPNNMVETALLATNNEDNPDPIEDDAVTDESIPRVIADRYNQLENMGCTVVSTDPTDEPYFRGCPGRFNWRR